MKGAPAALAPADGLFMRLRAAAGDDWAAFCGHRFVRGLGDGTLPAPCFRRYLVQDYLFLVQFARAWALAGYKADGIEDLRHASRAMTAILDREMDLHVAYCRQWGIDEAALQAAEEENATLAYTRYVLERGAAGDLLDLQVALAPCTVGYAEIGVTLAEDPATRRADNPYAAWIEMYSGTDYLALARDQARILYRLWVARAGAARLAALVRIFRQATRLEVAFWEMGMEAVS